LNQRRKTRPWLTRSEASDAAVNEHAIAFLLKEGVSAPVKSDQLSSHLRKANDTLHAGPALKHTDG
jgi:hypothetical protein